jgi:paraquat-inducible protein B
VKLLGVSVGTVKQVNVAVGGTNESLLINVFIEVDRTQITGVFGDHALHLDDRKWFDTAVNEKGLRGQLDILSLLSGQLFIALDMHPGTTGFELGQEAEHGYWEIPTLPSTKRELLQAIMTSLDNFQQTDLKGAVEDLKGLVDDLRTDLAALNFQESGANLADTLASAKALLGNPQLKSAVTNLNSALVQFDQLGRTLNPRVNPLLDQVSADLRKSSTLLDEAIVTLRQLQAQVEPSSTLSRELVRTLEEAGTALNALRQLSEQIDRNPSSLITGKKEPSAQQKIKP